MHTHCMRRAAVSQHDNTPKNYKSSKSQREERHAEIAHASGDFGGLNIRMFPAVGKKPAGGRGWAANATISPKSFVKLLGKTPGATGFLMLMGGQVRPGEFLMVLDVDPRNGGLESLFLLNRGLGLDRLPETATVQTGGHEQGRHFYFTTPFAVRSGCLGAEFPGIDIIGDGKYVIKPGSIHPETNRRYQTFRYPVDGITPLPTAALDLMKPVSPKGAVESAARQDDGGRGFEGKAPGIRRPIGRSRELGPWRHRRFPRNRSGHAPHGNDPGGRELARQGLLGCLDP